MQAHGHERDLDQQTVRSKVKTNPLSEVRIQLWGRAEIRPVSQSLCGDKWL